MKSLKIWWYKRKARAAYIQYVELCEEAPCGEMMLKQYSASAIRSANDFNECMEKLKELGEKVPSKRL